MTYHVEKLRIPLLNEYIQSRNYFVWLQNYRQLIFRHEDVRNEFLAELVFPLEQ